MELQGQVDGLYLAQGQIIRTIHCWSIPCYVSFYPLGGHLLLTLL